MATAETSSPHACTLHHFLPLSFMPAPRTDSVAHTLTKRLCVILVATAILFPFSVLFDPIISPLADQHTWTPDRTQLVVMATAHNQTARDTLIDLLLPEGVGGTIIVPDFDDNADGEANPDLGLIVIRAAAVLDATRWLGIRRGDQVEMHERAHLIEGVHPELVFGLLRRVAPADPDEYAATSPSEHFAEMVSNAWAILELHTVVGLCPDYVGAIQIDEQLVPGTAGAVAWLAPTWERVRGMPIDTALRREIDVLSAP